MPGWQNSTRKARLPRNWNQVRNAILQRDGHRCQHIREDTGKPCNAYATDVDHILSNKEGGSDKWSNLQALCPYHHSRKTATEGQRGRNRRKAATITAPDHPGLL